jgi:hypothetical protein
LRQTFKFTAQPRRSQREIRETKIASRAAVAAGVVAFLLLGAGWPILIAGVLTYMIIRLKQQRR